MRKAGRDDACEDGGGNEQVIKRKGRKEGRRVRQGKIREVLRGSVCGGGDEDRREKGKVIKWKTGEKGGRQKCIEQYIDSERERGSLTINS